MSPGAGAACCPWRRPPRWCWRRGQCPPWLGLLVQRCRTRWVGGADDELMCTRRLVIERRPVNQNTPTQAQRRRPLLSVTQPSSIPPPLSPFPAPQQRRCQSVPTIAAASGADGGELPAGAPTPAGAAGKEGPTNGKGGKEGPAAGAGGGESKGGSKLMARTGRSSAPARVGRVIPFTRGAISRQKSAAPRYVC